MFYLDAEMKNEIILHSPFSITSRTAPPAAADKLSCGTRRAAVAAQRKALCKQVQLVHIKIQLVLLGQMLDDVQILVLSGTEKVISRPKRSDSEVTVSRVSRTRTSSP